MECSRPKRGVLGVVAAVLGLLLATPTAAFANNEVIDYDPLPNSATELEPSRVTIAFSDNLTPGNATIVVKNSRGEDITVGAFHIEANNIYANLSYPLPRGTYTTFYRVQDADGTPFGGQFDFTYGKAKPAKSPSGPSGRMTWRGASQIPQVVALPGDPGQPAATTTTPTPTPSAVPTIGVEPQSSAASETNKAAAKTGDNNIAWIAAAALAVILAAAAFVLIRKRRA